VDVVEPFVPPADLEPEPDPEPSPAPDHSAVKTNNGKSTVIISPTALIFLKRNKGSIKLIFFCLFSESFESLYNVGEMIGSGGFGRVYEGTRRFDSKKVNLTELYKHVALACIKTYLKHLTDGLTLGSRSAA